MAEDPAIPAAARARRWRWPSIPDNLLSTVQVGITLIGMLTGVFGGEAIGLADRRLAARPVAGRGRSTARADRHRHRGQR